MRFIFVGAPVRHRRIGRRARHPNGSVRHRSHQCRIRSTNRGHLSRAEAALQSLRLELIEPKLDHVIARSHIQVGERPVAVDRPDAAAVDRNIGARTRSANLQAC